MQSQLPPGIEKLVRVEPQQLKSERQLSQPAQTASHLPSRPTQQQLPGFTLPLAQWQVVRMLYSAHSVTPTRKDMAYQTPNRATAQLTMPTDRGILAAKFELDGQPHQLRWQISQAKPCWCHQR
ncbi:hypothetical protein [Vibrio mexicanus]|uniref:hypothetical protein n=1 Tax=Vibrio mexicanus TaxID=1004326 RepID=UPI00063CEF9D|nr:hypothetical protein [Vibrio mexicanus]